jgi:hypothetical protein
MTLAPLEGRGGSARRRRPSRMAQQLADAFAPCSEWSEVRVIREGTARRAEVIELNKKDGPAPYNWAEAA